MQECVWWVSYNKAAFPGIAEIKPRDRTIYVVLSEVLIICDPLEGGYLWSLCSYSWNH